MTMLLYYNQFIILTTRAFKFIYAHLESGFFSSLYISLYPYILYPLFSNMLATLFHQKTNAQNIENSSNVFANFSTTNIFSIQSHQVEF